MGKRSSEKFSKFPCVRYDSINKRWLVRIRRKGFRVCKYFQSKTLAERYYLETNASIEKKVFFVEDEKTTVVEAARKYYEDYVKGICKPTTLSSYNGYLKNHIEPFFRYRKLVDISRNDCEMFKLHLTSKCKLVSNNCSDKFESSQRLSNETINKILKFLRAVFQYWVDSELLARNPLQAVKLLKVNRPEAQFLSTDDARLLLIAAKNDVTCTRYGVEIGAYYTLLLTALTTGLRQGELLALKWDRINFEAGYIIVNENYTHKEISTVKTQSSNRYVFIPQYLRIALLEHKASIGNNPYNLVFPNREGNYIDGRNLTRRVLPRLLKQAGLEKITWHQLRHTCISALAEKRVNPAFIQRLSGHSNLKTTTAIYTHISDRMNKQAMDALEQAFNIEN